MPICKLCKETFPNRLKIDGKIRNLKNRKYCIKCSKFGLHNTTKLDETFKERKCQKCQTILTRNNTYKSRRRICKKCLNKQNWEISVNHKKRAVEFLGGKCIRCGFDENYIVFEFHHPNSDKEKSWGELRNKKGWESILKEIKKCQLVCSNCHKIIHWEIRNNISSLI
jgi:hypothetical protein